MKKIIISTSIIFVAGFGLWYYYKIYPRTQVDWLFDYKGTDKYEVVKLLDEEPSVSMLENFHILIDSVNGNVVFGSYTRYGKVNIYNNKISYKKRNFDIYEYMGETKISSLDYIMSNGTIVDEKVKSNWLLNNTKKSSRNFYYGIFPYSYSIIKNDSIIPHDSIYFDKLIKRLYFQSSIVEYGHDYYYFYINEKWHIVQSIFYNSQSMNKRFPEKNENPRFFPLSMESKKPKDLIKLYDYDAKSKSTGYSWGNSWFSGGLGKPVSHGIRYTELYMPKDTLRFKTYGVESGIQGIGLYTNDSLYYKYGIMFISLDELNKDADIPIPDRYKNGGLFLVRPRDWKKH